MKKNPRIYFEKKKENNKKPRHTKCLKKVKTKLEMHATGYLHIKIKVICIICITFLTSSRIFLNILTIYK